MKKYRVVFQFNGCPIRYGETFETASSTPFEMKMDSNVGQETSLSFSDELEDRYFSIYYGKDGTLVFELDGEILEVRTMFPTISIKFEAGTYITWFRGKNIFFKVGLEIYDGK